MIPASATWFSVIDLKNAFFSIPIAKESRDIFGFSLGGRSFRFKRAPQGYCESPSICSQALKTQLDTIVLPDGATLIQYIDDLLVATDTEEICKEATLLLLHHLSDLHHKVSLSKLQYCRQEVTYLGHLLSKEGRKLTSERIQAIAKLSVPKTQREVRAFLGITSYCRQWIPNFSLLAKPLVALTYKDTPNPVPWSEDCQKSFSELRNALCSAPVLGTPNYSKPFTLYVHEKEGCALSVLTQSFGDKQRICAYFLSTLDPVAKALPSCLRATASAAVSIRQSAGTEEETKGRVDLKDTPLVKCDGTLWVDGSCFKLLNGDTTAAYAVTTLHTIVEAARIPHNSAQAAELIALTRACVLSKEMKVTIYTDSQYVFGVAHSFGRLWKERGFLTSHGAKIQHGQLVNELLESLTLPLQVAIVKCSAHKKVTDDVGRGNAFADEIAKETAKDVMNRMYVAGPARWVGDVGICEDTIEGVKSIHAEASEKELSVWKESTGKLDENGCQNISDGCSPMRMCLQW
ncbi:hypothetical protein NDU88_004868 [Pleurodeles waltl]|uniref:ribonuclease H n=1 Tax=Pleurodeles waltl TaxID=8319 RepID=A0AAV7WW04_PLEWA|nr:hypothetical protein NDU88_004868 [Pleurodeles waltl]